MAGKIEPRAPPLKSWAFAPSQKVLIANVEEEKEEPVVQQLTRRYREKSISNPSVQPGVPWRVDEATAAARRAPLVERHPFISTSATRDKSSGGGSRRATNGPRSAGVVSRFMRA